MLLSGAMVVPGLNACTLQREMRQAQALKCDSWRDYLNFLSYALLLGVVETFALNIVAEVLPFSYNNKPVSTAEFYLIAIRRKLVN